MVFVEKNQMMRIAPLFRGWNETMVWSCLQGYMGNAWADEIRNPVSAQIITGDFCFFAGVPNAGLVRNIPEATKFILMVPQNEAWAKLIEQEYKTNCRRLMRYAIRKEPDVFDAEKLRGYLKKLPDGYSIEKINKNLFQRVKTEPWSKDFCSQFPSFDDYEKFGIGFVAVQNGIPVSGASSYTVYDKGIEIEIDTKKEYRRKGLALACASKLILECLERGLYPSWDAANRESVALSEKLGYHFDKEYVTYAMEK